ncbi:MAG TPA: 50S ribosomal protein L21 [Firmicutes bacterium]|uniref:Large ribosomal subunit protein bL21 n=1 Tax=Candidatus Fermentithermobacillus carboniphilus TaxID=3085328 RepID=A0AAT9L9A3_9FIRM|nr:MAG: 50S ribosomal protein L21 [Candidatus Fermentithermobacillus carboniphilus]HHW18245.1 50S ribosomal protein L21 [Candidatus Fermentithermobacillaceae bacterium]
MYAILETGGKQYRVSPGSTLRIEKIDGQRGDTCTFEKVLAISTDGSLKVGNPYVEGARVRGTIVRQGKARKILVFKYKAKSNYRRRYGHRQHFTEVRIDSIEGNA